MTACSLLFLVSSYSYSETYSQQYQVGDTGPNGGVVTDVVITSTFVGEEIVQEGDFLEVTETYQYTETVTESVESISFTTTTNVTPVTTTNLVPSAQYTDTNINVVGPQGNSYGMSGAEFTTGNQGQDGGTRVYSRAFNEENKQSVEYGVTVYSHGSNASVPACANTTSDCRDDWSLTVRLYNNDVLIDTIRHEYLGINWTGSRDYSWTHDVSTMTFDYGEMELYGIDRGFYGGYYGPGFSDIYTRLTYNVVEQIVNRIVSYTEIQTVSTTDVYVYDSIYNPQVEIISVDVEPITETSFEVVVEAESFDTEIVEVFEVEFETVETISDIEIEFESVEMEMEMDSGEADGASPAEESQPSDRDDDVGSDIVEDDQSEEEVDTASADQGADEAEEEVEKPIEVKPQKKQGRYSVVMDSVKVALMVQNEATQAFTEYRQETIPDVPFYSPVQIDGGEVIDNPYGRWMTGASEALWDNMVDMQWQK